MLDWYFVQHLPVNIAASLIVISREGRIMQRTSSLAIGALLSISLLAPFAANACTRILSNDSKLGVFASRTMDWPESTEPKLIVFPRGIVRDGGLVGTERQVPGLPAKWKSQHGSVIVSAYGVGTMDGMNEKGLGGHARYLSATDFGARDPKMPGVQSALMLQYVLDNAATVGEAVAMLEKVQVAMAEARGHKASLHLALEDTSGDSAIIEWVGGKKTVHRGRQYKIMTNDPPFDQQLALLKAKDFSKPTSDTPLPGNVKATDRFQRAAYYLQILPEPKSEREAVAGVMAIARNASVPFGAPYAGFGIYNTEYRTAMNLTDRNYYFELSNAPSVVWLNLAKLDFSPGAPVMMLDPNDVNLAGDVTGKFQKIETAPF
jgi:penicillin V acylase-like amidase (Ntn superfamily)